MFNYRKKLNFINIKIKIISFCILFITACQPIESLDGVVFDNELLSKINFNSEKKIINNLYEITYADPYIDHSIPNNPLKIIDNWLNDNMVVFGTQNKLIINILDASIKRTEIENKSEKKFAEKTEFFYEIFYSIEFTMYDDNDFVLATAKVEAQRTTTSGKFISINERNHIIDNLILNSLIDISLKSEEILKIHMSDFIL